ncbi:FAD-binding protein [Yoonia sediminilitoris]|uniref:Glycolate oxidase FAD binding subunit n=1 Tax=Yoonia sediminilitoris TaxID=1286148 RepID=A0A2T6K853_9RHOB|nr:FAD-binding protein [Yoonia sediminilitoris]PUB10852.1 glycolate oxidase FAD binding subunit [Yoonia sediminilitoris]RCW90527.1 glycolate oxidase FAD binding subunit [Yoonia sediminilitoris]
MTPKTEQELAEVIAGSNGPLRIVGGGTRPIGQSDGDALGTSQMRGITLHEPGALTLVAKAGTPVAEIEAALAKENQRLAFEPMDHRALLGTTGEPTIGGVVAANVSGPRRIAVGACRDFMLGVRFVDGSGNVIKNGGRVMKNVTGYDLVKLMTGSYGTLGVLTEVSLKVLPGVAQETTLALDGLDDATAVAAMSAALSSPYEVTGVAHDPVAGKTLFRLEGFADSVAYRAAELTRLLAKFGQLVELDRPRQWQAVRDVVAFAGQPGDVWRLSVKPSDAAALVAKMDAKAVLYDWGGGLVWALTDGGDLRARLGDFQGHATLIRGTGDFPVFQPEHAPLAAISAGLRAKFDPRNILNRGLMQ